MRDYLIICYICKRKKKIHDEYDMYMQFELTTSDATAWVCWDCCMDIVYKHINRKVNKVMKKQKEGLYENKETTPSLRATAKQSCKN